MTTSSDPAAVDCRTCKRTAGQWCRTASGGYALPHVARLDLAAVTPPPGVPAPTQARYDAATYDQATYAERTSP